MKQSMGGRAPAVVALVMGLLLASCSKTQQARVQMLPTPVQVSRLESRTVQKTLSLNGDPDPGPCDRPPVPLRS